MTSNIQERTRSWRRAESLAILADLGAGRASAEALRADKVRGAIMLGHHADDQLETILLKGLRGCHLSNICGMRWQNGAIADLWPRGSPLHAVATC